MAFQPVIQKLTQKSKIFFLGLCKCPQWSGHPKDINNDRCPQSYRLPSGFTDVRGNEAADERWSQSYMLELVSPLVSSNYKLQNLSTNRYTESPRGSGKNHQDKDRQNSFKWNKGSEITE